MRSTHLLLPPKSLQQYIRASRHTLSAFSMRQYTRQGKGVVNSLPFVCRHQSVSCKPSPHVMSILTAKGEDRLQLHQRFEINWEPRHNYSSLTTTAIQLLENNHKDCVLNPFDQTRQALIEIGPHAGVFGKSETVFKTRPSLPSLQHTMKSFGISRAIKQTHPSPVLSARGPIESQLSHLSKGNEWSH